MLHGFEEKPKGYFVALPDDDRRGNRAVYHFERALLGPASESGQQLVLQSNAELPPAALPVDGAAWSAHVDLHVQWKPLVPGSSKLLGASLEILGYRLINGRGIVSEPVRISLGAPPGPAWVEHTSEASVEPSFAPTGTGLEGRLDHVGISYAFHVHGGRGEPRGVLHGEVPVDASATLTVPAPCSGR